MNRITHEVQYQKIIQYSALFLLTIMVVILLALPTIRMFFKLEIDYNEGWNAFYSQKAIQGQAIYSLATEWTTVNYPPLSFYINGFFGLLLGDIVLAGRLLSFLSLIAITVGVAYFIGRKSKQFFAPIYAGLICIGSFAAFTTHYVGMFDPQMLGHAFTFMALLFYLSNKNILDSTFKILIVAVFCVLGLFIKHSIVALPFAIGLDILIQSRKKFLLWWAFCLAATMVLVLFTTLMDGKGFLPQLAFPRRLFLSKAIIDTARFGLKIVIPLLIIFPWLIHRIKGYPIRVISIYFGLGLIFGIYMSGGYGSDVNMFFDCIIALSLLIGLFLAELNGKEISGLYLNKTVSLVVPIFLLSGLILMVFLKFSRIGSPNELRYGIWRPGIYKVLQAAQDNHRADASFIRRQEGPILSENLFLCFISGKEFVFDPFFVGEAIIKGKIDETELLKNIESGFFKVIQLEAGIPQTIRAINSYGPVLKVGKRDRFTQNTKLAIAIHYRLARRSTNGFFYLPSDVK